VRYPVVPLKIASKNEVFGFVKNNIIMASMWSRINYPPPLNMIILLALSKFEMEYVVCGGNRSMLLVVEVGGFGL
jgi:hypothetical protein